MDKHEHIFFDLDHTLWDFEANSKEALSELYADFNLAAQGVAILDEYLSNYQVHNLKCWELYRKGQMTKEVLRTERFRRTLHSYGIDDAVLFEKLSTAYLTISPYKTNLLPGTVETLEYLKAKNYPLHILTNGFEEVQHIKMERSGLRPYFETVITSEQVGVRKPDPKAFLGATSIAKARKEHSVMIGDNLEVDVIGAREVGLAEVYYNPSRTPHNETLRYEVHHLTELKKLF